MIRFRRRGLALIGTAVLTAATVGAVPATSVSAAPALAAQATPFSNASFLTYATGAQVHLNAVSTASSTLANVDQAFSAVSANSGNLASAITDTQTGSLVQPSLPGANAYGRGAGLEVGLGLPPATANQIKLGIAEASSPPLGPLVTKTVLPINIPGVLVAGVLKGIAGAAYLPSFCPVGQPLAYGEGDAAGVGVLGSPPLVSLSGSSTQTAQSQSRSDLVANSDGTFGLQSTVQEHIAPISVNLGTGLSIQISVGGSGVNNPITLTTHADGHGNNTTTLTDSGTLVVDLVAGVVRTNILNVNLTQAFGPNGLLVDANALPIVGPLLTTLGVTLNLGVAVPPKPIPGFPTGANAVSAQFNLVSLNVGLGALKVAGLYVGHMQTGVDLASGAIACTVPVSKVANPPTVQAGNSFKWVISVPSSAAAVADSTCDLTNIKATDRISVNKGAPTFTISSISNGGTATTAGGITTVSWPNLGTYHPGDPPILLTITVDVPSGSPAGVLQDTANVIAGLGNCTGGITGVATAIGAVGSAIIGGGTTLIQPEITAAGSNQGLPATGAGPLLPWIAFGLLVLAEGTRRVLRRAHHTP